MADVMTVKDVVTIEVQRPDNTIQKYTFERPKTTLNGTALQSEFTTWMNNGVFLDSKNGTLMRTANGYKNKTAYRTVTTTLDLDLTL